MDTIRIARQDLINRALAARSTHKREYNEAKESRRLAMVKSADEAIEELQKSREELCKREREDIKNVIFTHPKPINHDADYATFLEMLQLMTANSITITAAEFRRYVMADWGPSTCMGTPVLTTFSWQDTNS